MKLDDIRMRDKVWQPQTTVITPQAARQAAHDRRELLQLIDALVQAQASHAKRMVEILK